MKPRSTVLSLMLLLAILLTACGGAATPDAMLEDRPEQTMTEPTHADMMTNRPQRLGCPTTPPPRTRWLLPPKRR